MAISYFFCIFALLKQEQNIMGRIILIMFIFFCMALILMIANNMLHKNNVKSDRKSFMGEIDELAEKIVERGES